MATSVDCGTEDIPKEGDTVRFKITGVNDEDGNPITTATTSTWQAFDESGAEVLNGTLVYSAEHGWSATLDLPATTASEARLNLLGLIVASGNTRRYETDLVYAGLESI